MSTPIEMRKHELVEKMGFQPLGSGMFATVYGRKYVRSVIKIGRRKTDAYLGYVKEIMESQPNPFFPRIEYVKRASDYYEIKMEKLDSWNSIPKRARQQALENFGVSTIGKLGHHHVLENIIHRFDEFSPPVVQMAKTLMKLFNSPCMDPDMHEGNVMFRWMGCGTPQQMVITDPVCGHYYGDV